MDNKPFMFVPAWIRPLDSLPAEERWNVVASIVEYATSGTRSITLSPCAEMAFAFISAEIDRLQTNYQSVCEKRRAAANSRWSKKDSDACISIESIPEDYKTKPKTKTETKTKNETPKKTSSTATGVCVRMSAGKEKPFDESQLLTEFFSPANQMRVEALAMQHHLETSELRRMAEEITIQWALTDKTHESYHDASTHLIFALGEKINRERKSRFQAIADGVIPAEQAKGMLGIDEYIDAQGRRTYNGVDIIPHDAPPRPGRAFWWNQTTQSWDDIQ